MEDSYLSFLKRPAPPLCITYSKPSSTSALDSFLVFVSLTMYSSPRRQLRVRLNCLSSNTYLSELWPADTWRHRSPCGSCRILLLLASNGRCRSHFLDKKCLLFCWLCRCSSILASGVLRLAWRLGLWGRLAKFRTGLGSKYAVRRRLCICSKFNHSLPPTARQAVLRIQPNQPNKNE